MPNQAEKNGLKVKKIKLPQMNFFLEKQLIKFSCTYWALWFCKIFKKILRADPELQECAIFGPKMVHLPPKKFFEKIINITLNYLLAPFIVQKFKKILPADSELWECAIFGPKKAHLPK